MIASPSAWTAAIVLLIGAALLAGTAAVGFTLLACAVTSFVAWSVARDFFQAAYTAAGVFHPAFLAVGFFLWRRLDARARGVACSMSMLGVALLAAWGLAQAATGQGRAHALFETPNALATVVNLALAPLLVRMIYGDERRPLPALVVLLAAALVATLSRGGFVALLAGMLASWLVVGGAAQRAGLRRMLVTLAGGCVLGVLVLTVPASLISTPVPPSGPLEGVASTFDGSVASRSELYRLALSALGEHPWLGAGYLGFNAVFEAGQSRVPSYAPGNGTYFVHNDYLQTFLELGVPGVAALLAIVLLPFWLARRRAGASARGRAPLHAALAGIATMAVHALGDFPFYVPVCLLLFGALLGELDRLLPRAHGDAAPGNARWAGAAKIAATAGLALLLLPPPLAEAAAAYGERHWRSGDSHGAAFGFELARRFQPRDWRYHWYAGQFWYSYAAQTGAKDAAERADQAFAAAIAANPYEPRPLLARVAVQMRFAAQLDNPRPNVELRAWAERALSLAPLSPGVRRDYAAARAHLAELR